MRRLVPAIACLLFAAGVARTATARAETPLRSLAELKEACREAREPGRRSLYVVQLGQYRFGRATEDGFLPIDTRHNLRAFGGAAALFPSDLEPIGFRASEERQRALREARRAGAKLRVGFFLGFDGEGQPCVLRASVSVSTVRMDVAFVELVDSRGRVIARDDTERLRAWRDDEALDRIEGEGPRVAVEDPWVRQGTVPAEAVAALRAVAPALGRCHARNIANGGERQGRVLVQVQVVGGRIREASVAFTTFGEEALGECVVRVLQRVSLPATTTATFTIPLRFVAD